MPAAARAAGSRPCATATRSRRRTPAACAWSRSRVRGCWCRRARARSSTAWSCGPGPSASTTPARWCSSSSDRRSTCRSPTTSTNGTPSTAPIPTRYGPEAATVAQPVKVDNDLYVRDYAKCILCYQCVDACGEQWQNSFVIDIAGRGFDARVSTENDVALPDSACVYCGNCIQVCPTGALMFKSEHDMRRSGYVGSRAADHDRHDLRVLRRRLQPHPARAGQHDREGVVTGRQPDHARQSVRERSLRLPARPEPPRPNGVTAQRNGVSDTVSVKAIRRRSTGDRRWAQRP